MITVDTVTDVMIRALRDEARAVVKDSRALGADVGDLEERIRACNAALGIPTGDGALGLLDQRTCRERVAKVIANEGTARHYGLLTAETISDDQVRSVWTDFHNAVSGPELMAALREPLRDGHAWTDAEVGAARGRCAEILNARAKADIGPHRAKAAS